MPANTRLIKSRMKSVKNTRKITKAMELVAASKMRRAVAAVLGTRPYASLAFEMISSIGKRVDTSMHPLLREPEEVKSILLVLYSSDRGLAGGFNVNMIRKTYRTLEALGNEVHVDVICVGKKGIQAMRKIGKTITASFTDLSHQSKFEEILPLGKLIISEFSARKYDQVLIAYTDFISAITQTPKIIPLLPIGKKELVGEFRGEHEEMKTKKEEEREYTFEPDPLTVLNSILPRLVETMLYQALLESSASEHSARMMAMRSASDAASDMIDDLTFTFNQARQAGITQEIAEISAGKAALE